MKIGNILLSLLLPSVISGTMIVKEGSQFGGNPFDSNNNSSTIEYQSYFSNREIINVQYKYNNEPVYNSGQYINPGKEITNDNRVYVITNFDGESTTQGGLKIHFDSSNVSNPTNVSAATTIDVILKDFKIVCENEQSALEICADPNLFNQMHINLWIEGDCELTGKGLPGIMLQEETRKQVNLHIGTLTGGHFTVADKAFYVGGHAIDSCFHDTYNTGALKLKSNLFTNFVSPFETCGFYKIYSGTSFSDYEMMPYTNQSFIEDFSNLIGLTSNQDNWNRRMDIQLCPVGTQSNPSIAFSYYDYELVGLPSGSAGSNCKIDIYKNEISETGAKQKMLMTEVSGSGYSVMDENMCSKPEQYVFIVSPNNDSSSYFPNTLFFNYRSRAPIAHQFGETYIDSTPSCNREGSSHRTCTVCGYEEVTTIERTSHSFSEWQLETQGTCITPGTERRTCHLCGETETRQTQVGGHTYTEWALVSESTCTEHGLESRHCTLCGEVEERYIDELAAHRYGEWTIIEEDGIRYRVRQCNKCNGIEREELGAIIPPRDDITEEQQQRIDEAVSQISAEVVEEISNICDEATNILEEQLNSGEITQEEYEERVEIVQVVMETAIILGGEQEAKKELGTQITESLPETFAESTGIDLSSTFDEFYQRQLDILLGKTTVQPVDAKARKNRTSKLGAGEGGIDYSISKEEYGQIIDFVDNSIENMTNAALLIRECSGEKLKQEVAQYIETVSASSFRDFDKEAADNAFVEQAELAIMLNMQEQVQNSLTEEYNKNPKTNERTQLYNQEMEAIADVEDFKVMVIEILRQNYAAKTGEEVEFEEFEPIFERIFRNWALNQEDETMITLGEITQATISSVNNKGTSIAYNTKLSTAEIIALSIIGVIAIGLLSIKFIVPTKKEGVLD